RCGSSQMRPRPTGLGRCGAGRYPPGTGDFGSRTTFSSITRSSAACCGGGSAVRPRASSRSTSACLQQTSTWGRRVRRSIMWNSISWEHLQAREDRDDLTIADLAKAIWGLEIQESDRAREINSLETVVVSYLRELTGLRRRERGRCGRPIWDAGSDRQTCTALMRAA